MSSDTQNTILYVLSRIISLRLGIVFWDDLVNIVFLLKLNILKSPSLKYYCRNPLVDY